MGHGEEWSRTLLILSTPFYAASGIFLVPFRLLITGVRVLIISKPSSLLNLFLWFLISAECVIGGCGQGVGIGVRGGERGCRLSSGRGWHTSCQGCPLVL